MRELKGFNTLQDTVLSSLLPSSLKILSFIKDISIFGIKSLRKLYNFKCKFSEVKLNCRKDDQRSLPNKFEVFPNLKMDCGVKHTAVLASQYLLSSGLLHFLFRR